MNDTEKNKLFWACRRGMLELDVLLLPFAEHQYVQLSQPEKHSFHELLLCSDPQLLAWLLGQEPVPSVFETVVASIQRYARSRY